MAHYLVTGAGGFIGSNVVDLLLDAGHQVTGVDNLNDAYDVRLKQWRLQQLQGRPDFAFQQLDISDQGALRRLFAEESPVAGVINLAARAGVRQSVADPWGYFETNTTGTLNLLELCRAYDVPKFVLASTSSLYGADNPMPWQEAQHTSRPLTLFGLQKGGRGPLLHLSLSL
ncbi:MAG: GDP-mannose 4,6-dehydratase [Caldilineaceae bacterium]